MFRRLCLMFGNGLPRGPTPHPALEPTIKSAESFLLLEHLLLVYQFITYVNN